MAGNPAPDWYPDPENPAVLRWWDGARWSGETRSAAGAAAGPGLPPGSPAVTGQPGPAPFGGIGDTRQGIPASGPAGQPGAAFPGLGAGMPGPGDGFGDPGGPGADGMHASWREPAVEAWAAVYRAAEPAAGKDAFPVRRWVLGGAAAAVIAGVAAWFLVGALGGSGGHPAASHPFRGGVVTDRAAGISFRVPAGAGWARVARPGDGFTLMLRAPAPGARGAGAARPRLWAVAASEPLPAAIGYRETAQLRADGIRAAEAVVRAYFPRYGGKLDAGIVRQAGSAAGRPAYVVTFRIGAASGPAGSGPADSGPAGGTAAQTAAVVIVSRGTGKRPGLLFVTVPDTMSNRLAAQITGTARPAG